MSRRRIIITAAVMPLTTSALTCVLVFGSMAALGTHYSWMEIGSAAAAAAAVWYLAYIGWAYRALKRQR
jgi:hypothetical protein